MHGATIKIVAPLLYSIVFKLNFKRKLEFKKKKTICYKQRDLVGAFAKFQETTVSFVMSVCPSTWNNWAQIERVFMKFDISVFFFENP